MKDVIVTKGVNYKGQNDAFRLKEGRIQICCQKLYLCIEDKKVRAALYQAAECHNFK